MLSHQQQQPQQDKLHRWLELTMLHDLQWARRNRNAAAAQRQSSFSNPTMGQPSEESNSSMNNGANDPPIDPVFLESGIDISTVPHSKRASFPSDLLPPFEHLTTSDFEKRYFYNPSFGFTFFVSAVGGAVVWSLIRSSLRHLVRFQPIRALLRLVLLILVGRYLFQWVWRRRPSITTNFTHRVNVSSSPLGPCDVTCSVLSISNSHAGTHADGPAHFLPRSVPTTNFVPYHDAQYTGSTLVVDLSALLLTHYSSSSSPAQESNYRTMRREVPLGITDALLAQAFSSISRRVQDTSIWRVLFVTRRISANREDITHWEPNFAHLELSGAQWLISNLPNLLLFGIDTPSVDGPQVSPICHGAHGILYSSRVAILENLDFKNVYHLLQRKHDEASAMAVVVPAGQGGASSSPPKQVQQQTATAAIVVVLKGSILTTFNPMQNFPDSRGCCVTLFIDPL